MAKLLAAASTDVLRVPQAFVAFADASGAAAAKAAIHGRLFAGITVQATFLTPEQFTTAGGTIG